MDATVHAANGTTAASFSPARIARFYQQFFPIQDQVLGGTHPRIKLPDDVLREWSRLQHPQQGQQAPPSATSVNSNGIVQVPVPLPFQNGAPTSFPPTSLPGLQLSNAPPPPSSKPSSAGFDPMFLTKSEDLIRAELQLKRQRLERALKDQIDHSKQKFKERDTEQCDDYTQVLANAWEIVKPVSGLQPKANANSVGSESFDENDYYSSQMNSWASETPDTTANVAGVNAARPAATGDAMDIDGGPNLSTKAGQVGVGLGANANQKLHPAGSLSDSDEVQYLGQVQDNPHGLLEESDEEYEPPAADISGLTVNGFNDGMDVTYSPQQDRNAQALSHNNKVSVVTNHIESPIAPQPERVSPLATVRVPGFDQSQENIRLDGPSSRINSPRSGQQTGFGASPRNRFGRKSPNSNRQGIKNPRKRRRDGGRDSGDGRRRDSGKRIARSPVARSPSPETYIKEEPVSPPPFAGFAEPQPPRRRLYQQLPEDVEIISPRDMRMRPSYHDPHGYPEEPTSPGFIRATSRSAYRMVERDDQDLRRVASLQYARRPHSPSIQYGPIDGRPSRAVSHAYIEHAPPSSMYHETSTIPPATRYIRSERSRSPPYIIEDYPTRARSPMVMAPPPPPSRRVVYDEEGRMYYAAPAPVEVRQSVAPPSRTYGEPYYERAPTREPTMRAPTRAADTFDEDDAAQRMPPPPTRRFVEQPEVEVVDHRAYRQREYSLRPVDPSLASREPIERREVSRYEDMPPPRDIPARAYSVRPEVVRREPVGEYVARHGSVAPPAYYKRPEVPQGYREVSVVRTDMVPLEERRYKYAPQPQLRRYVDDPAAGEAYRYGQ